MDKYIQWHVRQDLTLSVKLFVKVISSLSYCKHPNNRKFSIITVQQKYGCVFVKVVSLVTCGDFKLHLPVKVGTGQEYKNLIWGSVLDGSFQPKG